MFARKNSSGPIATCVPSLRKFRNQRNRKSNRKEDMDFIFVVLRVILTQDVRISHIISHFCLVYLFMVIALSVI
jgi:hypothetical protein